MIYHYAFHDLVQTDPECREIWDRMPEVRADGAVSLLRHGLNEAFDDEARSLLAAPDRAPLYKLTWKGIPERPGKDSVLAHLLKLNREEARQSLPMQHTAVDQGTQ